MPRKYRVIYADPPWDFHNNVGGGTSNVKNHYPTMSVNDIKALNISGISKKNAILFLWACEANIPAALEVMKSWGFTYKTIAFVWVKLTKNKKIVTNPSPWTSKCTELCLLGTKGAVSKYVNCRPHEFIATIREEHSKKPEEARKRIEQMFPKSSKIELFARNKSVGWDAWGNEVCSDIRLE